MSKERPKTSSRTFDKRDQPHGFFTKEQTPIGNATYKNAYGTGVTLGKDDPTVQGKVGYSHSYYGGDWENGVAITNDQFDEFMDWLKANTAWHKTKVWYDSIGPRTEVVGFQMPTIKPVKIRLVSVFHRNLTDKMQTNLDAVDVKKKERQAREKKTREAERKREEDRRRRYDEDKGTDDLASALKILKKHGLKVVTVAEKAK